MTIPASLTPLVTSQTFLSSYNYKLGLKNIYIKKEEPPCTIFIQSSPPQDSNPISKIMPLGFANFRHDPTLSSRDRQSTKTAVAAPQQRTSSSAASISSERPLIQEAEKTPKKADGKPMCSLACACRCANPRLGRCPEEEPAEGDGRCDQAQAVVTRATGLRHWGISPRGVLAGASGCFTRYFLSVARQREGFSFSTAAIYSTSAVLRTCASSQSDGWGRGLGNGSALSMAGRRGSGEGGGR